jgi:hypothetical protein
MSIRRVIGYLRQLFGARRRGGGFFGGVDPEVQGVLRDSGAVPVEQELHLLVCAGVLGGETDLLFPFLALLQGYTVNLFEALSTVVDVRRLAVYLDNHAIGCRLLLLVNDAQGEFAQIAVEQGFAAVVADRGRLPFC